MELEIKDLVKDNTVEFECYRQGFFYYRIKRYRKEGEHRDEFDCIGYADGMDSDIWYNVYTFPVPLDDIGTATLLSEDKAITFMRWIRKAIEDKTLVKI